MAETREKNYRGQTLCRGDVSVGDRVVYEDMANPRKVGTVVADDVGGEWGVQYRVVFDDFDKGETTSDCRQKGWTMLDDEAACKGCGLGSGYRKPPRGDAICDLCVNAAGGTADDRNAHYAAVRLYRVLRTNPLANAHGATTDLVLWTKQRANELGWANAPTLCWEGGPYEWAVALTGSGGESLDESYSGNVAADARIAQAFEAARESGIYFECITSFMMAAYRV